MEAVVKIDDYSGAIFGDVTRTAISNGECLLICTLVNEE